MQINTSMYNSLGQGPRIDGPMDTLAKIHQLKSMRDFMSGGGGGNALMGATTGGNSDMQRRMFAAMLFANGGGFGRQGGFGQQGGFGGSPAQPRNRLLELFNNPSNFGNQP